MIIKSIYMKNFKKFEELYIPFTSDLTNKTIIFGGNASGKTTILYAIYWCVYNENIFADKKLLNDLCKKNMLINEVKEVKVVLEIEYNDNLYKIESIHKYKKINDNEIKLIENKQTLISLNDDSTQKFNKKYNYESFCREAIQLGILDFWIDESNLLGNNSKLIKNMFRKILLNLSKEEGKCVLVDIKSKTLFQFSKCLDYDKSLHSNEYNYTVKFDNFRVNLLINNGNEFIDACLAAGPRSLLQVSFLLAIHDSLKEKFDKSIAIKFPILVDGLFGHVSSEYINNLLANLIDREEQIIMFENSRDIDYLKIKQNINIISID